MNREIATGAASIYPLTGDVSSSAGSPTVTVTGLQNIPIQAGFLVNNDFLVYDSTQGMWVPRLIGPTDVPSPVQETPAGTLNGTNKVFTTSLVPTTAASVTVFLNGVQQIQGVDITISGATITFTVAPISTDYLIATYLH